jgi:mono/diheme cytochrome c family protein
MVLALSTAHQIGLATTGALFIIFALVSSFVLPRADPNFPGRWRNWYLVVCVVFFLAMMSAVVVFGREQAAAHEIVNKATAPKPSGDPAAGKAVFAKYSCHSCHTFTPAGATGKVGPDLDNLKELAAKAGQPLDQFITTSVTDPNAYIAPGYKPGMPKFPLTPKEVEDVVAFLSSGQ